jgi:hypothetical protein
MGKNPMFGPALAIVDWCIADISRSAADYRLNNRLDFAFDQCSITGLVCGSARHNHLIRGILKMK